MLCLVTQFCPTLCNPMNCNPPDSFVHGDSPGKNTGVGCHALHQGIFPTQGSNRGLLHCRWILYQLRYYFYFNNLEVNFGKKSNFPCIRNKLGALDCVLGRQLCSALYHQHHTRLYVRDHGSQPSDSHWSHHRSRHTKGKLVSTEFQLFEKSREECISNSFSPRKRTVVPPLRLAL